MAAGTVHPMMLKGPAGRLEALWKEPEGERRGSAVIAHADPIHGGTMHFKVVFRMSRALARVGFGVLRFNFRGVGASEGTHDQGRGERDDFRSALDHAERLGGVPLVAGGFSFGSTIALSVGEKDPRVGALIAAGIPLSRWNFEGIDRIEKPALVISGDRDEFAETTPLREGVARRFARPRVEVIANADHFLTGHLDLFEQKVFDFASWLASRGIAA